MPASTSAALFRGAKCLVLGLGDDVVGDVARAGGVVAELHGELATAGGHGAGGSNVSEADELSIDSQIRALKILRNNPIAQKVIISTLGSHETKDW